MAISKESFYVELETSIFDMKAKILAGSEINRLIYQLYVPCIDFLRSFCLNFSGNQRNILPAVLLESDCFLLGSEIQLRTRE